MHFNPRAPCGARQTTFETVADKWWISTHAPLAGRDIVSGMVNFVRTFISTHAPLAGRDIKKRRAVVAVNSFQPTRPLRGATNGQARLFAEVEISTHAPLAGRDRQHLGHRIAGLISTHAPLAGRDPSRKSFPAPNLHFNPRAPCGARQNVSPNQSIIAVFQPTRPLRGATVESP